MTRRIARHIDRVVEYRHRPRLVAWGGKPGRDIQIGSRRDLRRQAIRNGSLADIAAMFGEVSQTMMPLLVRFGVSMRQAGEEMTRAARAINALGLNVELAPPPTRAQRVQAKLDELAANVRRIGR